MNPAPTTATTTTLPGGNARAFDESEYFEAFTQTFPPQSATERELIEQAAQALFMQENVAALQAQRISANLAAAARRDAEEIERQTQRLFHHRGGPIEEYGSLKRSGARRRAPSSSRLFVLFDEPAILVQKLQQSAAGIERLIKEWGELRAVLERGGVWKPQHKLKAARLLGRQPWDAIVYDDVFDIFYASWLLDPRRGNPFSEIATELGPEDSRRFMMTVKVATKYRAEQLRQDDTRCALLAIVDRALDRLKAMLPAAQERDERDVALKAECLLFDFSPEGERLRRSEHKHFESFHQALNQLIKLRQGPTAPEPADAEGPDQSDAGSGAGAMTAVEVDVTTADQERLEPSDNPRFAVRQATGLVAQVDPVAPRQDITPPADPFHVNHAKNLIGWDPRTPAPCTHVGESGSAHAGAACAAAQGRPVRAVTIVRLPADAGDRGDAGPASPHKVSRMPVVAMLRRARGKLAR